MIGHLFFFESPLLSSISGLSLDPIKVRDKNEMENKLKITFLKRHYNLLQNLVIQYKFP
jgi:hypothetical protein